MKHLGVETAKDLFSYLNVDNILGVGPRYIGTKPLMIDPEQVEVKEETYAQNLAVDSGRFTDYLSTR